MAGADALHQVIYGAIDRGEEEAEGDGGVGRVQEGRAFGPEEGTSCSPPLEGRAEASL